jgi:TPR repeat protein
VSSPDARNPHVQFDEQGWETERCHMAQATAPILDSTECAATLEYLSALNDLGRLRLAGAGVPKNHVLARSLFEQVGELGNAKAMNNLGLLYFNGKGMQRNINVARSWFDKRLPSTILKRRRI